MVSSRKQDKVMDTVAQLEKEPGCVVKGVVCHVAKPEHRKNLIKEVKIFTRGLWQTASSPSALLLSPLCLM